MKKIKKILAAVMTLAMVLGMSMTTMAATHENADVADDGNASITVTGLASTENVTVTIYKVVDWNPTTSSWEVEDWAEGNVDGTDTPYVETNQNPYKIHWEDLREEKLAEATAAVDPQTTSGGATTVTFSGLDIGAYLIVAAGTDTQYTAMGTYTYVYDETTNLMVSGDVTIAAKGSTYDVTKTFADGSSSFVHRGETITYYIDSTFPSFDDTQSVNKSYTITDIPDGLTITGIKVLVNNTEVLNPNDYTLTVGEVEETDLATTPAAEDTQVSVVFTDDFIGDINAHAGHSVRVEVTAKVTAEDGVYSNKAQNDKNGESDDVESKTGTLVINKTDNATNPEDRKPLAGAIFNVYKDDSNKTTPLKFVMVSEGVYALADGEGNASPNVVTDSNGTITIKGLEEGIYGIKETEAPDGYGITDVKETYQIDKDGTTNITFNVVDSKLASLPETGGIGTTIFTIGGCIIMIAAAGLFFASRRKSSK